MVRIYWIVPRFAATCQPHSVGRNCFFKIRTCLSFATTHTRPAYPAPAIVSTASFRSLRRLRSRNMAGLTDRAEVSLPLRSWTPQPAVSDCPCRPKSGQHSAPFHQRRVRKVAVTQSLSRWRDSPGIEMAARLRPAKASAIRREAPRIAEDKAIAGAGINTQAKYLHGQDGLR